MLFKLLTKNYTRVPLFWVDFDLRKYQKFGEKGSCNVKIHPMLKDDKYIENVLNVLIDHIRAHYDMTEVAK
jgi:hypothetical protein